MDTQGNLTIEGTIAGFPYPNVQVFHQAADGTTRLIDQMVDSRYTSTFEDISGKFVFTIRNVRRSDGGMYSVVASNGVEDDAMFTVVVKGEWQLEER